MAWIEVFGVSLQCTDHIKKSNDALEDSIGETIQSIQSSTRIIKLIF